MCFPVNFSKKETQTQVFSCEFCEIFKNTFFVEHLRTAASNHCQLIFVNIHFFSSEMPKCSQI